jgi:chromosome partitioning protein
VRTIASYHHKGGVGKTTTAVALAAHAADRGSRTLLWDLDPQGAATRLLGADRGADERVGEVIRHGGKVTSFVVPTPMAGLELVPADPSLRTLDRRLDDDHQGQERIRRALTDDTSYDVVVLDCPPSVSLTAAAVLEAARAGTFARSAVLMVPVVPLVPVVILHLLVRKACALGEGRTICRRGEGRTAESQGEPKRRESDNRAHVVSPAVAEEE